MNEQQMHILHQKIHAGVKAIAASIEQHRQRGQSISIWLEAKLLLSKLGRFLQKIQMLAKQLSHS